jgi:hypothetical protein
MNALFSSLSAGPALDTRSELSSGLSVLDAREALTFWRSRLAGLPWHRRAARREARMMVSRSRARLVGAHLEARGFGSLAFAFLPLLAVLARSRRDHMRWVWVVLLRRNPLVRRWLVGASVIAVASVAALAALAALAVHVLAF